MKVEIPDKAYRTLCWDALISKLEEIIALPDVTDFWDIKKEGTSRRDAQRLERKASAERLEAAKRFVYDRRNHLAELPTCFLILGFKTLPTLELLRKRFLQLARETHPDVNPHQLQNEFKRYRQAYEEAIEFLET